MYSILERKGTLEGLKVVIVGDILHKRVASLEHLRLSKFGCELRVVGPSTLIPRLEKLGVKAYANLGPVFKARMSSMSCVFIRSGNMAHFSRLLIIRSFT